MIMSLKKINELFIVTETPCVLCEAGTESLNVIQINPIILVLQDWTVVARN
jgi:hypothetical protein